jgi:4-aminobutyrate aminotransferase-like enzyme
MLRARTLLPSLRSIHPRTMHASATNGSVQINAAFGAEHTARGVNRLVNAVVVKGEGSYLTLDDGRRMLDFTTGIGVTGLGARFPPSRHTH